MAMAFEIVPASETDFSLFVPPLFETMGTIPFVATMYPGSQTDQGLKKAERRFIVENYILTALFEAHC